MIRLITPLSSLTLPVSASEVKTNLRLEITDNSRDEHIENCIRSIATKFEKLTGNVLMSATYELVARSFESSMPIAVYPVSEITKVEYYDSSNVKQTLPSTEWEFDNGQIPAKLIIKAMPTLYDRYDAVVATFIGGFTPTTLPPDIKMGVIIGASTMYENPLEKLESLPTVVTNIIHDNKLWLTQ